MRRGSFVLRSASESDWMAETGPDGTWESESMVDVSYESVHDADGFIPGPPVPAAVAAAATRVDPVADGAGACTDALDEDDGSVAWSTRGPEVAAGAKATDGFSDRVGVVTAEVVFESIDSSGSSAAERR